MTFDLTYCLAFHRTYVWAFYLTVYLMFYWPFFFGSDVPQRAGWLAIGFGPHPCWDVLKSRAHMFPFDNCRASHTGDAIVVWALVLFMCSARARRCRAHKPTIFRLSALRSTDWARQPLYKGHALQLLAQRGYIQKKTAAQRATATSRRRHRESQHRYSVSVWQGYWKGGSGSKSEARSQDPFLEDPWRHKKGSSSRKRSKSEVRLRGIPFWRIQAADGTKRGPAAGKLGTAHSKLQAPSVLHCHGVSMWRRGPFWKLG